LELAARRDNDFRINRTLEELERMKTVQKEARERKKTLSGGECNS